MVDTTQLPVTREQLDLWSEVRMLARLIHDDWKRQGGTPGKYDRAAHVRLDFQNVPKFPSGGGPDRMYSDAEMIHLRTMFYALPDDVQRRILNGWSPCPARASRTAIAYSQNDEDHAIFRVLRFEARAGENPAWASQDFVIGAMLRPVQMVVLEGATQADAMQALEDFRKLIDARWPELIDAAEMSSRVETANREASTGHATGSVWEARDWREDFIGYLVSEADDADAPVAFVHCRDSDKGRGERLPVARAIAANFASSAGFPGYAIDLRPYGQIDSKSEMPGFVFSLRCRHVADDGTVDSAETWEPSPFCRFRLANLMRRHAEAYARRRVASVVPFGNETGGTPGNAGALQRGSEKRNAMAPTPAAVAV